ncbi:MAG: hypothetical protein M1838_004976 [Thelocarpon superellum]|nr:MAG: hypothetical protein M1838_004976 [Thelocarpon superellum]
MATTRPDDDGSEDVQDFLQRIRELGDKRDREDEERTKKLEEEILQGRKERQARRAERARSLSPTKDSPISTPPSSRGLAIGTPTRDMPFPSPPPHLKYPSGQGVEDLSPSTHSTRFSPDAPPARLTGSRPSPSAAMAPSSTSPLAWQRRPDAQATAEIQTRPLPPFAGDAGSPMSSTAAADGGSIAPHGVEASKEEIAHALAGKDPAWFRQTADRGRTSPAYRRDPGTVMDEPASDRRLQLPGMSGTSTFEAPRGGDLGDTRRSPSPSRNNSVGSSGMGSLSIETTKTPTDLDRTGPWPAPAPLRLAPTSPDNPSSNGVSLQHPPNVGRNLAMSPSQGRISPERPHSPTKGLGGFVQSAMMKRSDSVNKRWSTQSNTTLSRGDSFISDRSGPAGSSRSRPTSPTKHDPSPTDTIGVRSNGHRDSFDQGVSVTAARNAKENERLATPDVKVAGRDGTRIKDYAPSQVSGDIPAKVESAALHVVTTPPASPTKTFEQKRWSPTKASWLESALNKGPESPKPKASASQQPNWMTEINKTKRQRESVDLDRGSDFKEISTGGLLRAPPLGGPPKALTISGLPPGFSSGVVTKGLPDSSKTMPLPARSPLATTSLSSSRGHANLPESTTTTAPSTTYERKRSPPPIKPKPDTPPKNLRDTLKPRQGPGDNRGQDVPEFKNVFGKLKRTTTQNYVAPDELKNNILRGKAGLAATGGPKKSERKDEFKESLLKQKEAMKLKAAQEAGTTPSHARDEAPMIPEAVARKQSLTKPALASEQDRPSSTSSSPPTAVGVQQVIPDKAKPSPPERGSSGATAPAKESVASGKLAARFNPALAGLLARGPPSTSSTGGGDRTSTLTPSMTTARQSSRGSESDSSATIRLTHMTKARARGPKRRLPGAKEREVSSDASQLAPVPALSSRASKVFSQPSSPTRVDGSQAPASDLAKEPTAAPPEPSSLRGVENVPPRQAAVASPLSLGSLLSQAPNLGPPMSKSRAWSRPLEPKGEASPTPSPTKAAVSGPRELPSPSHSARSSKSPLDSAPSPATSSFEKRSPTSQHSPMARAVGGVVLPGSPTTSGFVSGLNSPRSPQSAADRRANFFKQALPGSIPSSPRGPTASTTEVQDPLVADAGTAQRLLMDFFEAQRKPATSVDVDTQMLAGAEDGESKIRTTKTQIWQISGDGKMQTLPSHQQHILFEDHMYLCTHVFDGAAESGGTEVYLWVGDNVAPSDVEDVQLFSRKMAREHDARLLTCRQGKEPSNLFQALGGILITRRGSSARADGSSAYMLCGRRHLGHIAFDEVDMTVGRLCPGFPYIISSATGKAYLWRGRGSSVDELSSARLIGMDLGLTGALDEIEDGAEPAEFFRIFGTGGPAATPEHADHWPLKPNHTSYRTRLFRVDAGKPTQMTAIEPFSQADLDASHIYCVDAYFELYILVGARAQSLLAEFKTALMFAQEYGILAASLEDRPFVPVSMVVLRGVPVNLQAVFRKWEDAKLVTTRPSTGQPPVTMITLSAAIEATRE